MSPEPRMGRSSSCSRRGVKFYTSSKSASCTGMCKGGWGNLCYDISEDRAGSSLGGTAVVLEVEFGATLSDHPVIPQECAGLI